LPYSNAIVRRDIRMFIAITKENLHTNTNAKRRTFCGNSRANYFISPDCD
jgi:hypothetical protein